jgi:hypothetical protein
VTVPAPTGSRVTVLDDAAYNAFAGVARRSDGRLVGVFYRGGAAGETTVSADIYTVVSTDETGTGWGSAALLLSQTDACRDPKIRRLGDGTLAVTYTLSDDSTYWHPYVVFSTDEGTTWGTPVLITSGFTDTDTAYVSAPLLELPNGDLLASMYGDWGALQTSSVSRVSRSTDGGATWASLAVIASGGSRDWLEPNLCQLASGTLFCGLRSDNPGTDYIYGATSTDSGATWSAPAQLFQGSGQPACYVNAHDVLMLHYRNPSGYPRWRASEDGGATWSAEQDFSNGQTSLMAYGGFVRLSNGGTGVLWSVESAAGQAELYWRLFDDGPPAPTSAFGCVRHGARLGGGMAMRR